MNAFFKGAGRVLRKSWVWSLLLVLCLAALVWCFGPLLAVDDYRFWQGGTARLLSISVLFLLWGLAMVVVGGRRAARLDRPDHQARHQRQVLIDQERQQVRGRFKEALQTLKTSRCYGEHSQRWRTDLPWYLLIGEQGSGKSQLLAAGGVQFPLDRVDTPSGTTAYFDWFLADEAVIVESAGRYLTQPDVELDGAGWSTLLGLLKSRRRARPLNGVVVTLAVDTLLGGNEHDLDLHARHVHARLQDIHQTLHMDVPIYLVLTQADRLPGFAEFFDTLHGDSAQAVLGERLPASKTGTEMVQVRDAFEALLKRLGNELIPRLHQERSAERRGVMLDFPRQVARIGERLCLFVESGFSAHRFQRISGLRGFYLTSAETGDRRGHFGEGLFKQVIFAEADLAGLQAPERRRLHWRQGLLILAASGVVVGAGVLWAHSYAVNHQRLMHLAQLIEPQPPAAPGSDATLALLPLLDSRRAATQVFPAVTDARTIERAGLYQGEISRPVLVKAYEDALRHQLLPAVAALLETQVQATLDDREKLMDSLRAYLMLNLPERRDTAWLAERVAAQWSALYGGDSSVQIRLNEHFSRLLTLPFESPLNAERVAAARQALRGESMAEVIYRVLRDQARNLEPYRLAQGPGMSVGEPLIPGFFTKRYVQHFEKQGPRLVNGIVQDNWVLGEGSDLSPMDMRQLMHELEQRYFNEYADTWSHALSRVRLEQSETLRDHIDKLAGLSSMQSPLVRLLQQVHENTRFPTAHERLDVVRQQAVERGASIQSEAAAGLLGSIQAHAVPDSARRVLLRRFEPLHQLLDAEQNPGGDGLQALRLLNEWHLQLAALNREGATEQAAFKWVKQRMEGQQPLLGQLRDRAARLPQPLRGWLEAIVDDSWRLLLDDAYVHVNQRYQSEVYGFYAKAIQRRYPFNAQAASEVALGDFQEFFKPRGAMARFYETHLKPFVIAEGSRFRLRGLDGRSLPMSRSLLDQLAKAQVIRQGFFSEDQGDWAVRFTLAPYSLDPVVSRAVLRIGDKQLEYRHGPIVPTTFNWPEEADNGRSSLVLERGSQRPFGIEKNSGPWSLFRLLELMQSEPANGRNAQLLKADLAGLRANFLLTSTRHSGPFQMAAWRTFRLPEQL